LDEPLATRINHLKEECMFAADEISAAIESGEDERQLVVGRKVTTLVERYKTLLEEVEEEDTERIERTLGRRVTDLRRLAEALTRRSAGSRVPRASDAGSVPFVEQRPVSKSIVPQRAAFTRDSPKYSVGGEVESWCGKCRDFRGHHIVAMVGDEPKQVICQACRSRHGYRTEPGRNADKGSTTPQQQTTQPPPQRYVDPEQVRIADQKRQLNKELDAVETPRQWDPRGRYKANEVIVHPEFGRGKIENVIKGSVLVRFRDRLRPLDVK
jgi:hypothetical protein